MTHFTLIPPHNFIKWVLLSFDWNSISGFYKVPQLVEQKSWDLNSSDSCPDIKAFYFVRKFWKYLHPNSKVRVHIISRIVFSLNPPNIAPFLPIPIKTIRAPTTAAFPPQTGMAKSTVKSIFQKQTCSHLGLVSRNCPPNKDIITGVGFENH